jgi:hypothetical protein
VILKSLLSRYWKRSPPEQYSSTILLKYVNITNVNVVWILEDIYKSDNVRMLAYLKDFDFSFLQLQFFQTHVLLLNHLDCNLALGLNMLSHLDLSKFTLSKVILENIIDHKDPTWIS